MRDGLAARNRPSARAIVVNAAADPEAVRSRAGVRPHRRAESVNYDMKIFIDYVTNI